MWTRALCCLLCAAAGAAGVGAAERGQAARALAAGGVFSVQSTVLLNAAERRDREVGYRLAADLSVAPARAPGGDLLLHFHFTSAPLLLSRGAHRSAEWEARGAAWGGAWGAAGGAAWGVRLRRGAVQAAYVDAAEPRDLQDYKKSLLSLFQFHEDEGERNETDISGECVIAYEALPGGAHFRKIKRSCSCDGAAHAAGAAARRATRVTLAGGALAALHAEEVVTLHAALKARAWHELARRGDAAPALEAAPVGSPVPLAMELGAPPDEAPLSAAAAVREYGAALQGAEAGAGGTAAAAAALPALLAALRAAPAAELGALLRGAAAGALPALCRALGLAGSAAAVRAASDFLQLPSAEALEPLAHAFLAGLALSPDAQDDAVLEALRLGAAARRAAVADSALLAAAAAASSPAARAACRVALTQALARCRDDACRAARLLALGNLPPGAADAALLLAHAAGAAPRVAAAALGALRAAPALAEADLARLERLAANVSRPLELRAAALELAVARRAAAPGPAAPVQLLELARALHGERSAAAHELRRLLWQRLEAHEAAPVRALLPLLPAELRTWDARAHGGTSSALRRDTGWAGAGWRARLDSVQVAARGVLRRGTVALLAAAPGGPEAPELEVELWTRGLAALAGAGGDVEGEEEEGAAGGLALTVAGARMPDVQLFDGQAELLRHVWAGTGAAPTSVLRAERAGGAVAALPLVCGAALHLRAGAAAALALDAHAAASLWHRTARGALALRVGAAADARAAVRGPGAALSARRSLRAQPRLRVALELDFYDASAAALCVRAAAPTHTLESTLELESVVGPRRARVLRREARSHAAPGRTLALGRNNDAACRTLRPDDDDDD